MLERVAEDICILGAHSHSGMLASELSPVRVEKGVKPI